jgi:hypothetical protein
MVLLNSQPEMKIGKGDKEVVVPHKERTSLGETKARDLAVESMMELMTRVRDLLKEMAGGMQILQKGQTAVAWEPALLEKMATSMKFLDGKVFLARSQERFRAVESVAGNKSGEISQMLQAISITMDFGSHHQTNTREMLRHNMMFGRREGHGLLVLSLIPKLDTVWSLIQLPIDFSLHIYFRESLGSTLMNQNAE